MLWRNSSPIPYGSGFRYSQSGYNTRQTIGGAECGTATPIGRTTVVPTLDGSIANGQRSQG